MGRIVFFGLKDYWKEYLENRILDQRVSFYKENFVLNEDTKEAEILGTFVFSVLDKKTLEQFPNLKLITSMSAGFDHIDLDYCRERGIVVTNAPKYGTHTVAETAFSLLLNLSRKTNYAIERTKKGNLDFEGLLGFDLKGKTIGVIGTGNIGQEAIRIANGFGMNVKAYDAFPRKELEEQLNFKYVSLDELLQCNIITIHVPYMKQTHHLLDEEVFSKMKDTVIINTSRGEVIDTEALIRALDKGNVKAAGLDVLEGERMLKTKTKDFTVKEKTQKQWFDNLRYRDNVLITPHLAFYTEEALTRILDTTLENIYDYIEERGMKNKVN